MLGLNKEKRKDCPHCEVSEETLKALEGKKDKVHQCSECGTKYKEEKWAEKCEHWCKEHKSRNSKIIKHSI